MKVLVAGAAGFIGSNLTLRLLERGDEVVLNSAPKQTEKGELTRAECKFGDKVGWVT